MPLYPNPAGGSMTAANDQQAASMGWNSSMGTFGALTYPNGNGGGGGGSGGGGGGGGSGNYSDILAAFAASSGFSLKDLEERKRQFDATLDWQKQMWANQGLPELEIRQRAQALAEQEFAAQNELAHKNFAEMQRQFNTTTGMDYLKTAASMGGPADYFQQSNYLRGAAANPEMPTFLKALGSNTGLAAFNAPGGTAPAVQSVAGLTGQLAGAGAPVSQSAALSQINRIGAAGGQALAPQALESLSPDEMALFSSGLKASGYSMPSFLDAYKQSRIAQQSAQAA